MHIALIGAGNVGAALAQASVAAGHTVTLSAAHPDHAAEVAGNVGAQAAASNREAVTDAEVVILAVPYTAVTDIVDEVGDALDGKVVVDATNPLNATYSGLAVKGTSGAEELQQRVPGAAVVKAFNTVFASRHADPTVDGVPLDGFYAADDEQAKATIDELYTTLGYRPIDAGGLRMARTLEEMAFLNITLNARNGWSWQTGWKLFGPTG